jgi:hypothetical protein
VNGSSLAADVSEQPARRPLRTNLVEPSAVTGWGPVERIALRLDLAAKVSGLGVKTLRRCMADGSLRYARVGTRVVILVRDLRAFLESRRV